MNSTRKISFTKMHGLGNDFMMVNNIAANIHFDSDTIRALSHRHFGVGFDQLLMIEKASDGYSDFKYRIFNADGGEVEQCGNGARCFARYIQNQGLSNKKTIRVQTMKGVISLYLLENDRVKVDMGCPDFSPLSLPMRIEHLQPIENNCYYLRLKLNNKLHTIAIAAVSMGNPHITINIDDVESFDVKLWGEEIMRHPAFPNGVNIGFMQRIHDSLIKLRVYERGTGETMACGTGACAAVVNGISQAILNASVEVQLSGGKLMIQWDNPGESVWMSGTATRVYEGIIEI